MIESNDPVAPVGHEEEEVADADLSQLTGAELLAAVETILRRFVSYPSEECLVAHVLWIAHAWVMDAWENTPRLAFLSPEPGSGKSRALEITALLVPRAVHAVNVTPAYLFRKGSDPAGSPTILYDEIDTVFGHSAKGNEEVRGMLNAGSRRGATAGRCVIRNNVVETEELPAYCAVVLAGLNDLPDTIMTRSVVVRMRRRAPSERVESFRSRIHDAEGHRIADALGTWLEAHEDVLRSAWPMMPTGIEDRNADCWEPLLAIAELAGGVWPERARRSAVALVADAQAHQQETLGIRLLVDMRDLFASGDTAYLGSESIINSLLESEEGPWSDLSGRMIDARQLAQLLSKYGISSKNVRSKGRVVKGYSRHDFSDAWERYLPATATEATPGVEAEGIVAELDVIDDAAASCTNCGAVLEAGRRGSGSRCPVCTAGYRIVPSD